MSYLEQINTYLDGLTDSEREEAIDEYLATIEYAEMDNPYPMERQPLLFSYRMKLRLKGIK